MAEETKSEEIVEKSWDTSRGKQRMLGNSCSSDLLKAIALVEFVEVKISLTRTRDTFRLQYVQSASKHLRLRDCQMVVSLLADRSSLLISQCEECL